MTVITFNKSQHDSDNIKKIGHDNDFNKSQDDSGKIKQISA